MKMFTVALVGSDGAGKTTIAQMLLTRFPLPMKRIYMGVSMQSSNVVLPTSRLVQWLKRRAFRKEARRTSAPTRNGIADRQRSGPTRRGHVGATLRVLHRVAEEWYRQLIARRYQRRGYIVLCDRHFLFEYNPASVEEHDYVKLPASYRLHLWLLDRFYPRPDLVIFLDAPPEVLLLRKQERRPEDVLRYRRDLIKQGERVKNFVTVDVSQPLDNVVTNIMDLIMRFRRSTSV